MRTGREWDETQDWTPYFEWLEARLFHPGRWAIMPDMPGAPSQLNDSLLPLWPFGQKGAPVWHMDGPIDRLLRLCERYDRVCLGWTGPLVGSPDYHARMAEVGKALGNRWPVLHMLRGVKVAFDYPFASADSTSLAQNGHRYDEEGTPDDRWAGRRAYAERLESPDRGRLNYLRRASQPRRPASRPHLGSDRVVAGRPLRRREAADPRQLSFDL